MNKPKKHFDRWNPSDDAKLRMMLAHGVDVDEIANHLQRTPATIRWRWWKLRMDDATDCVHDSLANETSVILPLGDDNTAECPLPDQKKSPIEMIERRWLWGLITTTRFKYADDY